MSEMHDFNRGDIYSRGQCHDSISFHLVLPKQPDLLPFMVSLSGIGLLCIRA